MMDCELLIELGCEELPASWLPGLTAQLQALVDGRLQELRLKTGTDTEAYATPRRLVVHNAAVARRQPDHEEVTTGPPVAAAYDASGTPTRAGEGFARRQGVAASALERVETPKGPYVAVRSHHRGRSARQVLPGLLGEVLRGFSFPKAMRWDAWLDDGRGELLFGRPVRWLLFLYDGRVVPFTIHRSAAAASPRVRPVRAGSRTVGHRFLADQGLPGRPVRVRSFDELRARLRENGVMLARADRETQVMHALRKRAAELGGRLSSGVGEGETLLHEVPDLIEWPSVVAGRFATEFLALPPEVLVTTLVHHQHYFPLVDGTGRLMDAFLAVTNTRADVEPVVARNAARVVTARLRDARFFWDADRAVPLVDRVPRLETIVFHKKVGTYREKAERVSKLAAQVAGMVGSPASANDAARAGLLAKADLVSDMVRELTELQGVMGGIYAREEGEPSTVWKAVYFHYLPVSTEPDSPPSAQDLGDAAPVWAAVSLADKLDTLVGMFRVGEKPTGSRDPFGLRRQAHGLIRILMDLEELTGLTNRPSLEALVDRTLGVYGTSPSEVDLSNLWVFLLERYRYLLEQRGFDRRNVRAVVHEESARTLSPRGARLRLEALPEFTESADFRQLAVAFKRVRNIARELGEDGRSVASAGPDEVLQEPAERALRSEIDTRAPVIERVLDEGRDYRAAFAEAAAFGPAVDRFFTEVFVMVDDETLRVARLRLMKRLEQLILRLADVSEIVPQAEV